MSSLDDEAEDFNITVSEDTFSHETSLNSESFTDESCSIASGLISNIRNLSANLTYNQAVDCYNQVVSFNVSYANMIYMQGLNAHNNKQYKKAIKLFDVASSINPDSCEYLLCKGIALNNLNKLQEALECYNKSIVLDDTNPVVFNYKGVTLMNMKSYEQSIECFNKAISLDSEYAQAIKNKRIAKCFIVKNNKSFLNFFLNLFFC